jgi:hypothetical protein
VPAEEADRRRIGTDRLLGEGDQLNTHKDSEKPGKKAEKATGVRKEAWRAHPYQARKKKA